LIKKTKSEKGANGGSKDGGGSCDKEKSQDKKLEMVNPEDGASDGQADEEEKEIQSIFKEFNLSMDEFEKVYLSEDELAKAFPKCSIDRIAKEREFMVTHFIMEKYLKPMQEKEEDENSYLKFICPLCLKLMQRCVTTVYGHSYCEYCLEDYLIYKETCFVCDFNGSKGC
jgi:hypothetical protein